MPAISAEAALASAPWQSNRTVIGSTGARGGTHPPAEEQSVTVSPVQFSSVHADSLAELRLWRQRCQFANFVPAMKHLLHKQRR